MNRAAILTGFLLGTLSMIHCQDRMIRGSIENAVEGPVLLASYYGDQFRVIDSLYSSSGFFYFILPEETPPGIFRVIYAENREGAGEQRRFVELIFNREDIDLVVSSSEYGPVAYFENSIENRVFGEFMDFEVAYETELMSLYGQLYPRREGSGANVVERYNAIQMEREVFMDSMTALYPELYAVRIMNAFRAPFIPGEIPHRERIDTLKECFFDRAPIHDEALLHAPVYPFKLMDFLSLYREDSLSGTRQQEEFMEAVDRIMVNVSPAGELREFVVEYLLEGFETLGMEQVQLHLAENYLDENCESDIVELVLSRMEGDKEMAPGRTAPDIVIRDSEGMTRQLSDMGHSYVLVLFWSSTCPHCSDMLPDLRDWYMQENSYDLEVLAISIDTSGAAFEQACKQLQMPWITAREPMGWQGRAPSDYHVYATPTMYLLDREMNIVARPSGFRPFLRALRKQSD